MFQFLNTGLMEIGLQHGDRKKLFLQLAERFQAAGNFLIVQKRQPYIQSAVFLL